MKRLLAPFLVALALLPAAAAAKSAPPPFVFGRHGGTIKPFSVTIAAGGRVSVSGTVTRLAAVIVAQPTLAGLGKLATAEGFWSMPLRTRCDPEIGGIAGFFIRIRMGGRDRTVEVVGGCNSRFDELFETLKAVAAVR